MIRTIGFLVQESYNKICWLIATSLYILACISTSIILGTFLAYFGVLAHNVVIILKLSLISSKDIYGSVIGLLAIAYALSDLGLFPLPRPRLMNAVPVTWWRWWRPYGAALAYGAALGLGLTTRIHFGAFYILCIWCVFKENPLYGAILMGLYGTARSSVLFPISRFIYGSCAKPEPALSRLTASFETAKLIIAVALIVFGTCIVVSHFLQEGTSLN